MFLFIISRPLSVLCRQGDEKPASQPLATGTAKRQTGLSEDIDPFNTAQKKNRETRGRKKSFLLKKTEPPENKQQSFSRALDVSLDGSQGRKQQQFSGNVSFTYCGQ